MEQGMIMRLPAELRQLVYLSLLAESTPIRHIVFDVGCRNLRSKACLGDTAPDTDFIGHGLQIEDIRISPWRKGHLPCQASRPRRGGLLGCLLACRTMYREFCPTLYTQTTFMFHELRSLRHFLSSTPDWMLAMITKISLSWQLPYVDSAIVFPQAVSAAFAEWNGTWSRVATMLSGLSKIQVTILVGDRPISLATKTQILRAFSGFKVQDKKVELVLPPQRLRYGGYWAYWNTVEDLDLMLAHVQECDGLYDFPGAQLPMTVKS